MHDEFAHKPHPGPKLLLGQHKAGLAAWAVLGVSLFATTTTWWHMRSLFMAHLQDRLSLAEQEVRDTLSDRLARTAELLDHVRATANRKDTSAPLVTPASLNLFSNYPEVLRVAILEKVGAEGASGLDFRETPLFLPFEATGVPAAREIQDLWGRALLETTVGVPADVLLSAPLHWETDQHTSSVAVMLRPVAQLGGGTDTAEADSPKAWIAALIDLGQLVQQARTALLPGSEVIVYDRTEAGRALPLVASAGAAQELSETELGPSPSLFIGGRTWSVALAYTGTDPPFTGDYSLQFLLGGLAVSVLLFDIALMVDSRRSEAAAVSELMTRRLRESESRIRAVVDHAPDAIITFDAAGIISTSTPGPSASLAIRRKTYRAAESACSYLGPTTMTGTVRLWGSSIPAN